LLRADDSLVKTLRSGRQRVTKKSVKDDPRYGLSKAFISDFIVSHPESVRSYRADLIQGYNPVDPAAWSGKLIDDDPEIREALEVLPTIHPGKPTAQQYHETAYKLIRFVFDLSLENFGCEYKMDNGRGRIDIIADNYANGGFFWEARHMLNATSVPMECKNYQGDLGNNEFNQIVDRLGPKTSRLGMVFFRSGQDGKSLGDHLTDRWLRHDLMILLIDDAKLIELVRLRLDRDFQAIDGKLRQYMRDVQYRHYS
jgi:hypothetical protein